MKAHIHQDADSLLVRFEQHLLSARGLSPGTTGNYTREVRAFLEWRFQDRPPDFAEIRPDCLVGFIVASAKTRQPRTVKNISTSLRVFFRFLHLHAMCDAHLVDAVTTVPFHQRSSLPRHLEEESLYVLLASLDGTSPLALRDRAMLLCIARLGLRASEVATLHLEDIDWEQGTLHVRKRKNGHGAILPLPREVGQAIVNYLKHGRPSTTCREIFVIHRFRPGRPIRGQVASDAVKSALRRTGLQAPIHGANLLRHSLATRMLHQGSSIKEIADLMGHRSLSSTAVYARVDVSALREVALPWPEVAQ